MLIAEQILAKTETLWREGRYLDAWATLDNLYPEDTCEPDAIAMTLRLMPEVGELANWKHGDGLAHLLEFADGDDFKIAAAEWRVEYAAFLLGIGKAKMALHLREQKIHPTRKEKVDRRPTEPACWNEE